MRRAFIPGLFAALVLLLLSPRSFGQGCQLPDQAGHGGSSTIAATSDAAAGFFVSENFSPMASGNITTVDWWGGYFDFGGGTDCGPGPGDNFAITYYLDSGTGCPAAAFAGPFVVVPTVKMTTGATLAGIINEWYFSATHAPVAVTDGNCYWIGIVNNTVADPNCTWLWETAPPGDGAACQNGNPTDYDMAFCVNLAIVPSACGPPLNDDCGNATAIAGEGTFPFDNTAATEDGPDHAACGFGGDPSIENDVWFCWMAPCDGTVVFETCAQTTVDTKIAVYDGCACLPGDADLIACSDDDCFRQSRVSFTAVAGNTYLLRVGTPALETGGTGNIRLVCPPANDECANAIGPLGIPSTTPGDTGSATTDYGAPDCGPAPIAGPGVWYTVTGTGNTMTASLCSGATAYDSKLSVFCGDCSDLGSLLCVAGNDDSCGLQSEVSWCSQAGVTYLVLVHGVTNQTGTFDLDLSDDGAPCWPPTAACIPIGACALPGGCIESTEADCAGMGGQYQGDNTACVSYSQAACGNAFEDIAGTGTPLVLGDDDGVVVGLGFTFEFFNTPRTDIGISSNGYLTFGGDLTDFSNDICPPASTIDPSDLIAPLWDDFNPASGGTVHYELRGTAPDRRFIVQWTDVPQFAASDMNTFQVLLFEGSNCIEFRYGSFTPEGFAGDYTIGIENAAGEIAYCLDGSTLSPGDCLEYCPIAVVYTRIGVFAFDSSRCFIATAAFGDENAPEVRVLRRWRDECLSSNALGRQVAKAYYALSPPLALVIAESPFLRGVSRAALAPVVGAVRMWLEVPWLYGVAGLALFLHLRRRRRL